MRTRTIGGYVLTVGILFAMAGGINLNCVQGGACAAPTVYKLMGPYAQPIAIVGVVLILIGIVLIWKG
jgi:hypothetical protein